MRGTQLSNLDQRSNRCLSAQYRVAKALLEAPHFDAAAQTTLEQIGTTFGWPYGAIWLVDHQSDVLRYLTHWHAGDHEFSGVSELSQQVSSKKGELILGKVWNTAQPVWIADVTVEKEFPHTAVLSKDGIRSLFAFPVIAPSGLRGVIAFMGRDIREPDQDLLQTALVIGSHLGQYLENVEVQHVILERESRFRKMTDLLSAFVWISNRDREGVYFNKAWLDYRGRTVQQESGIGWTEGIHPEDRDRCLAVYAQAVQEPQPFKQEYRLRCSDGTYRWVEESGAPLVESGVFKGIMGTCMDIEVRKRTEQELERKVAERTAELVQVNKELEAFSYSVSHDLRTPLRAIDGFSREVLQFNSSQLNETGISDLKRVRAAAQRMGQLIDDLLKLSQVSLKSLDPSTVSLSAIVSDYAESIQRQFPKRKAAFLIEPDLAVEGDANLLRIALENLMDYAWRFCSKRAVTSIEFGVTKQSKTSFFLKDNGVGFSPDALPRLFRPFERLHSSNEYATTGIGLATVQRIVQRHGGDIWVESVPDQGTTFYFTLPVPARGVGHGRKDRIAG